jgi:hypothetical protein
MFISRLTQVFVDSLDEVSVNIILRDKSKNVEGVPEGYFHLFYHDNLDHKVENHQHRHENDEKSHQKIKIQRRHYLINYLGVISSEAILETKCMSIHKLHHLFQTNL